MKLDPLRIELGLLDRLARFYGIRLGRVLAALGSMGPRYYLRVNTLRCNREELVEEMARLLGRVSGDENLEDAAYLPVHEKNIQPQGTLVEADRFAAEAVLQGAHLYAQGVRRCHKLKAGSKATVVDERGNVAGVGVARQGETSILTHRQGLAVEVQENRFGLPSLMETEWYEKGQIHLQSLPAMVTCRVLGPKPGELIADLNCAPAGKMSYLSQLTGNKARIVGFDRNARKLEKARRQLERLGCQNYQLVKHDSRYVHMDYSLRPDRVLVDPPCTGLGVTPKLFVDTTAKDVDDLSSYQKQFLTAASHIVKPGGVIVYSVCTITREECEDVARFGADELGLELDMAVPMMGRRGVDADGATQRFDPDIDGCGYFIARFHKN